MIRLFNRYWARLAVLSLAVEGPILFLSVYIGTWIRIRVIGNGITPPQPVLFGEGLVFAAIGLLTFYLTGLYDFGEQLARRILAIRLLRAFTLASIALGTVYFLVPELQIGRGVFALAVLNAGILLTVWRLFFCHGVLSDNFGERVLIVGAGDKAIELAKEILHRRHLGYRVVGFVVDDPKLQGVRLLNPRVIGTTDQCRELALAHGVTRVVMAPGISHYEMNMDALLACKTSGIRVQDGSRYYEQLTGKIMIEGLRKSWLVFSDGFVVSRGVRFGKRLLDLIFATVGLLLAAPIMLLVALAVRLDSPGPVLFRQERLGRGGHPFTLWKFRSMGIDAEADGARWAVAGDSRVTRVGRFIRKTRLDELPQLVNVLLGDMSLVGPRPERGLFVRQLMEQNSFYEQRLVVRPGLTGWAQIKAPYASSFDESIEKLKYDLYYVKNISLFLDLSILLSTARIVLLGRGAR